jgi:hypothetical protein
VCTTSFWKITFIRHVHNQNIGKPNNIRVFESKYPKDIITGKPKWPIVTYASKEIVLSFNNYIVKEL